MTPDYNSKKGTDILRARQRYISAPTGILRSKQRYISAPTVKELKRNRPGKKSAKNNQFSVVFFSTCL
jgi:hypothetical protein